MNTICFYIVMAGLVACMVDCAGGDSLVREGQVIDQVYKPSDTGWTTDSKGNLNPVYSSESYTVVVRTDAGIEKITTDAEGYYSVKPGKHVSYRVRHGWLSNHDWFPSL
jgi:hypothetical protein